MLSIPFAIESIHPDLGSNNKVTRNEQRVTRQAKILTKHETPERPGTYAFDNSVGTIYKFVWTLEKDRPNDLAHRQLRPGFRPEVQDLPRAHGAQGARRAAGIDAL